MSDTMTCPACATTLPATAAFCTNCGKAVHGAQAAVDAPPAEIPEAAPADTTQVSAPGLQDGTRVLEPPTEDPQPHTPFAPPSQGGPWTPAPVEAPPAPPAPMASSTSAPWNPPTNPPPPTYANPSLPSPAAQPPAAPPTYDPAAPPPWQGGAAAAAPPTWHAPPAPSSARRGSLVGGIVALVGATMTIIGAFTAWVSGSFTGSSLSGWDLTSGDKGLSLASGELLTFSSKDPYAVVALGIIGLVLGVLLISGVARTLVRIAAVIVGIGVIALLAMDWSSLASVVSDNAPSSFEITAEPGFYLTGAGGVLIAISALLPARKASN